MSLQEINPYPAVIFKDSFSFDDDHRDAAKKILEYGNNSSNLEQGNAKSSVYYQEVSPHKNQHYKLFFDWATSKARIILTKWGLKNVNDFYVGNSWINYHGNGGFTLPHNHGFSGVSLVAYISLPKDSGVTEFKDPHFELKNLHEYSNETSNLKEFYPLAVQQNDVIFFPGWLTHRSQINRSNESRIVLSANFINFLSVNNFTVKNFYSN